ncbi:MAG: hypothetical protein Q8M03_11490 [Legionella sp.]|nr:hypothetical protein [Legionella sp.]
MAKFKPETLKTVRDLYQQYLGNVPKIIEDANEQLELLKRNDFLADSYNTRLPYVHFFVNRDFKVDLGTIGLQIAPKRLLGEPDFCTPVHLLLKEFLQWYDTCRGDNYLEEIAIIEARIALFDELFQSETNLLELSLPHREAFARPLKVLQGYKTPARELDLFDVKGMIDAESKKLATALKDFKGQYNMSLEGNNYAPRLMANFDSHVKCLMKRLNKLSAMFVDLQEGWLLNRSEQLRQDMRNQLSLVAEKMVAVNEALVDIFCYAKDHQQVLFDANVAKDIYTPISHILSQTIPAGLNLIKWHVGTEEGRLYGVQNLVKLFGIEDLDIHKVHNAITPDAKQAVSEQFGLPSFSLDI